MKNIYLKHWKPVKAKLHYFWRSKNIYVRPYATFSVLLTDYLKKGSKGPLSKNILLLYLEKKNYCGYINVWKGIIYKANNLATSLPFSIL